MLKEAAPKDEILVYMRMNACVRGRVCVCVCVMFKESVPKDEILVYMCMNVYVCAHARVCPAQRRCAKG